VGSTKENCLANFLESIVFTKIMVVQPPPMKERGWGGHPSSPLGVAVQPSLTFLFFFFWYLFKRIYRANPCLVLEELRGLQSLGQELVA